MLPVPVIYDRRIVWLGKENDWAYRPQCMITVHGPRRGSGQELLGLLDTGADHLMLPKDVARTLGIDIATCEQEVVFLASGHPISMPRTEVDITIRGKRIYVTALFGTVGSPILIGLHTICKTMKFGIEPRGWLYGQFGRSALAAIVRAILRRSI